jgi:hypothetical protein
MAEIFTGSLSLGCHCCPVFFPHFKLTVFLNFPLAQHFTSCSEFFMVLCFTLLCDTVVDGLHYKTFGSIFHYTYFTELLQMNALCYTENISVMLCVRHTLHSTTDMMKHHSADWLPISQIVFPYPRSTN